MISNHGFDDFFDIFLKIFDWSHIQIWLIKNWSIDFVKSIDFHLEVDERFRSLKSLNRNAGKVSQFRSLQVFSCQVLYGKPLSGRTHTMAIFKLSLHD
jgi:hypothetical protein